MSATFGPVAEQHVNTSRRKLEEILVKVAMRTLMQMKMNLFSGENKKEVGGDPRQGGNESIDADDSNNFVGDENIVNINSNINDEDDSNINFEDDNNINHFSDDNNNQDATTKMFLINIIMMKLTITSMMKMTTRLMSKMTTSVMEMMTTSMMA